MSKRVTLALGVLWRIRYVCLVGCPDIGYVSDLKPHLETAQIGYKKIRISCGFLCLHACIKFRSVSDVGKRSDLYCQCKHSLRLNHVKTRQQKLDISVSAHRTVQTTIMCTSFSHILLCMQLFRMIYMRCLKFIVYTYTYLYGLGIYANIVPISNRFHVCFYLK